MLPRSDLTISVIVTPRRSSTMTTSPRDEAVVGFDVGRFADLEVQFDDCAEPQLQERTHRQVGATAANRTGTS